MPRRKELKGIAIDLGESFNSRNNDHLGYWAIGQICLEAASVGESEIALDILKTSAYPSSDRLVGVCESMRQMLFRLLQSHSLSQMWLEEATFKIVFDQERQEKSHRWGSSFDTPYNFKLTLVSDLGFAYVATAGGSCLPHDSGREQRRSGY